MIAIEPILATGIVHALRNFVTVTKLHPILTDFTSALVPISIATDLAARSRHSEPLRHSAWWTLFCATVITPFTAITGWLFWMSDDIGVTGMAIHKWLGSAFVLLLFGLFIWRWRFHRRSQWPTAAYYLLGVILLALLIYQGHLGGTQVFSDM